MSESRGPSSTVAVVDSAKNQVFVWWVNNGDKDPGMSRLCGAWVLDLDAAELPDLLAGRNVLATQVGKKVIAERGIKIQEWFSIATTLENYEDELTSIENIWLEENATRKKLNLENKRDKNWKKKAQLPKPDFPPVPRIIDIENPPAWTLNDPSEDHLDKVLRISHWLATLFEYRDQIEEIKASRTWLSS